MKRAILSRLQPFLAWPRSRSEAAIKGQVTMNGTFQWNSIWHGGFGGCRSLGGGSGGCRSPGGACKGWVMQSIPPGWGWCSPSLHPDLPEMAGTGRTSGCTPGLRGTSRELQPFGAGHGDAAWGRQEGLVQGERWGKGLAAASGCGIHPHIYSITVKQAKPVPAQSTAETAQHCPPLPSGAAPCDGEDSLGLREGEGTAPSFPVTL